MSKTRQSRRGYSQQERRQHVEAWKKSGLSKAEFCSQNPGLVYTTFSAWAQAYENGGPGAFDAPSQYLPKNAGKKRGRKEIPPALKAEITRAKKENPTHGARKIRDFLARFRGVKVAPNTVQKTLKAEKLELVMPKKRRRSARQQKVRRFERASAMQLWQSDITSMVLTRHSARVYLTVFLDDYASSTIALIAS